MAKSSRAPRPWYRQVADAITQQGLSFRQAASELDLELTPEECLKTERSKDFQDVLWQARFDYWSEVGSNPGRSKAAALGLLTLALQSLAAQGEWEKVIDGILKLAKCEGWVGGDSSVQVFAGLTARDIEEARKKIQDSLGIPPRTAQTIQPN